MIDKISGKAVYAIMSFGGFLGIGERYHPLPWSTLHYDESKGGYVVNLDRKMLEDAPTYDANDEFEWTPLRERVDKYYNTASYWRAVCRINGVPADGSPSDEKTHTDAGVASHCGYSCPSVAIPSPPL